MMNMNVFDLLYAMEGDIEPEQEKAVNSQRLENLSAWIDLNYEMIKKFLEVANNTNFENNESAQKIIKKTRTHLTEMCEWIGENVNKW